jgi:hypothetical protein
VDNAIADRIANLEVEQLELVWHRHGTALAEPQNMVRDFTVEQYGSYEAAMSAILVKIQWLLSVGITQWQVNEVYRIAVPAMASEIPIPPNYSGYDALPCCE